MTSPAPFRPALPGPHTRLRASLLRRVQRDAGRRHQVDLDGWTLILEPSVPDPSPFFGYSAPQFLGRRLDVRAGEHLLDVDSGCGLVAMHAARRGAHVTAADPTADALLCIKRSFLLGGLGMPALRHQGEDALERPGGWDVVTWCPPFLPGPADSPEAARRNRGDGTAIRTFLARVPRLLARGGRLLFPYPDADALPWLHDALTEAGLRWAPVEMERFAVLGPVRIYRAWVPEEGEAPGPVDAGESLPGAAWVLKDR